MRLLAAAWAVLASGLAGAAMGACSLTTDLDGLTGGGCGDACANPLPDADATSPGPDAPGPIEAAPDAPADSGTGGPIDGATEADATAVDWCAAQDAGYRLCSDFDPPIQSVTQDFDHGIVANGAGGSFMLDPTTYVSATQSALGTANPFPAHGTTGIRLIGTLWAFGATPSSLTCTAQWNPRSLSTTAGDYAHVIEVALYSDAQETASPTSLSINMQADGSIVLLEYYPNQPTLNASHTIPTAVTANGWLPVVLSFSHDSNGASHYAAGVGVAQTTGVLATPLPTNSHGTFEVGPAYFAGSTTVSSPGWLFGYDNVICY